MKKKVIVDFDNTFTLGGHDIDDLIAILYLLSCENIELPFVTTTFGNSNVFNVNKSTKKCIELFDLDILFYSVNEYASDVKVCTNEAVEKIKDYVEKYPNEVILLSLGSLKNLADLQICYPETVKKIKSLTAMGGVTAPLYFNNKQMPELNFSCDSYSAKIVLHNFKNVNIITGNNCMTHIQYISDLDNISGIKFEILRPIIINWLNFFKDKYNHNGVVLWDVIAGMYVTSPELFSANINNYSLTEEQLATGLLVQAEDGYKLNLPTLEFDKNLYYKIFTQISQL